MWDYEKTKRSFVWTVPLDDYYGMCAPVTCSDAEGHSASDIDT